ncbi:hypothetical protein K438DRAFT_2018007 [Mycena galopus ATCC 62051]|nr:hypothetical protein K438DRAFT_2018007 [Mycena galopus ATCC 62051]
MLYLCALIISGLLGSCSALSHVVTRSNAESATFRVDWTASSGDLTPLAQRKTDVPFTHSFSDVNSMYNPSLVCCCSPRRWQIITTNHSTSCNFTIATIATNPDFSTRWTSFAIHDAGFCTDSVAVGWCDRSTDSELITIHDAVIFCNNYIALKSCHSPTYSDFITVYDATLYGDSSAVRDIITVYDATLYGDSIAVRDIITAHSPRYHHSTNAVHNNSTVDVTDTHAYEFKKVVPCGNYSWHHFRRIGGVYCSHFGRFLCPSNGNETATKRKPPRTVYRDPGKCQQQQATVTFPSRRNQC